MTQTNTAKFVNVKLTESNERMRTVKIPFYCTDGNYSYKVYSSEECLEIRLKGQPYMKVAPASYAFHLENDSDWMEISSTDFLLKFDEVFEQLKGRAI